jgi:CRP/FNR family transcriptional regulator
MTPFWRQTAPNKEQIKQKEDNVSQTQNSLVDPLAYLPCSSVIECEKGQEIYSPRRPPRGIYFIIDGRVKQCRTAEEGSLVVLDIFFSDEFLGEEVFLGQSLPTEAAFALEATRLMWWTVDDIEEIIARRPKLAIAFLQLLVKRSGERSSRIESFAVDNIARRLAGALIRFSEFSEQKKENGWVKMMPFTHQLLSEYVGTTRETVTQHMKRFREWDYLRYSRHGIVLWREALRKWLRYESKEV